MRMRLNRFVVLGQIISLIITFSFQAKAFAQSGPDLVAHYVEVTPGEDGMSYHVNLYVSVLDGSGSPIQGLGARDLTIAEDGQKVEIQELAPLTDESTTLLLVMDTSETMYGASITDAKPAAANFVQTWMRPGDQVAVFTFNDTLQSHINFTVDPKTITDGISRIEAKREAGSCLYDAMYAAVEAVSKLKVPGSRAVLFLTDGRDETPNQAICSVHRADDVIHLAAEGETRTPIHVIALGINADIQSLKRISELTGGLYSYASGSSKLTNVFQALSDQLRSQYVLTYESISLPGAHVLTVDVIHGGERVQDSRSFSLAPLPASISFVTPLDGETMNDLLKIAVSLATQGDVSIGRVAFVVNGTEAGMDDTKPYELALDVTQYAAGAMTVTAIAYDANGTELARRSINLVRAENTPVPISIPTDDVVPVQAAPEPAKTNSPIVYMAIFLSGLSIVTIGLLAFFLLRQQKQVKASNVVAFEADLSSMQGIPLYRKLQELEQASQPEPSGALGALTIEFSDDSARTGERFEIRTPLITLGRSVDNDLHFPNDKPVSRHHAEIYQISDKLYLREVETADSSGTAKSPKYGTFVNQVPMGVDPMLLKTGDEIQLGKRVRLTFESYTQGLEVDAPTMDDLTNLDDLDRTQEQ
jgi:VWFA-related protein